MQTPWTHSPWLEQVGSMHWSAGMLHSGPFQPSWHMHRPFPYSPLPLHSTGHVSANNSDPSKQEPQWQKTQLLVHHHSKQSKMTALYSTSSWFVLSAYLANPVDWQGHCTVCTREAFVGLNAKLKAINKISRLNDNSQALWEYIYESCYIYFSIAKALSFVTQSLLSLKS